MVEIIIHKAAILQDCKVAFGWAYTTGGASPPVVIAAGFQSLPNAFVLFVCRIHATGAHELGKVFGGQILFSSVHSIGVGAGR